MCWGNFLGAAGQAGFQSVLFETKRYMIVFVANVLAVRQLTLRIGVQYVKLVKITTVYLQKKIVQKLGLRGMMVI